MTTPARHRMRCRQRILAALVCLAITVGPCAAAPVGAVQASLHAVADYEQLSFSVVNGPGTLSLPRAAPAFRTPTSVHGYLGVVPSEIDESRAGDLSSPLGAAVRTTFGAAGATADARHLSSHLTLHVDSTVAGDFVANSGATRSFEVPVYGDGTLLMTLPVSLSGALEVPALSGDSMLSIIALVDVFAYRVLAGHLPAEGAKPFFSRAFIDFGSDFSVPLSRQLQRDDLLALEVPFASTDSVLISIEVATFGAI